VPNTSEFLEHLKKAFRASYGAVKSKDWEARVLVQSTSDLTLKADIVSNQAIINYFEQTGLSIKYYSEESEKPLMFSGGRHYAVVADPIDGSINARYGMGMLPYGPIIGMADRSNPKFRDFIVSGYLDINSGNLFYAVSGEGSYSIEKWIDGHKKALPIRTSEVKSLSEAKRIVLDGYMLSDLEPPLRVAFLPTGGDNRSYGAHLALLSAGSIDALITGDNCLHPGKFYTGEEIGPLYLLLRESGGSLVNWRGKDIRDEKVGFDKRKRFHTIAASTKELCLAIAERIQKIQDIAQYMEEKGL